jgi:hypothetical protein
MPIFASACASGRIHLRALKYNASQPPGLSLRGLASFDAPPSDAVLRSYTPTGRWRCAR